MASIKQKFATNDYSACLILGMAGTGKSQLAAEFGHLKQQKTYNLIRWLRADTAKNLKQAYFALGKDLGINLQDYADLEDDYKAAIDSKILTYGRILLIYDNVELASYAATKDYQPQSDFQTTLHVLLTSRYSLDPLHLHEISIEELNDQDIQDYFRFLGKPIDIDLAESLGTILGHLPLALAQASAYMLKHKKKPQELLDSLNQSQKRSKVLNVDHSLQPIDTLWDLNLGILSPKAINTLTLCAYLDIDNLPRNLLKTYIETIAPDVDADDLLLEMHGSSLLWQVGAEASTFRMHQLLQNVLQNRTKENERKSLVVRSIGALKLLIGEERYQPEIIFRKFWQQSETLFLQVKFLIEHASVDLTPVLYAQLHEWAGDYHQYVTFNYSKSLNHYQICFQIRLALMPFLTIALGNSCLNLGNMYRSKREEKESLVAYELALKNFESVYAENHAAIAIVLNLIGYVLNNQGKPRESLDYFKQSLSIRQELYGNTHLFTADSYLNIGCAYHFLNNSVKALEFIKHSLDIYKKSDIAQSRVADCLQNIGYIYEKENKYKEANDLYEQSLAIYKAEYGEVSLRRAMVHNNIARLSDRHRKYLEALTHYKFALTIYKQIQGENINVADCLHNIGLTYQNQSKIKEALEHYEKSLIIYRRIYGAESRHPDILRAISNMSVARMLDSALDPNHQDNTILPIFNREQVQRDQQSSERPSSEVKDNRPT